MNQRLPLILFFLLAASAASHAGDHESAAKLIERFKNCDVFWQQFEIGKKIVALHDTSVLPGLVDGLKQEDRHARGNVAFVFASLGDDRGFDVIRQILADRSQRPEAQGIPGTTSGQYYSEEQITADRYYAVHLFGDLKDPRAVPILLPLLRDNEVREIVPWSLGQIDDKRAIKPLIDTLDDRNPSMRVIAILALEQLKAKEALPRLHELLDDNDRSDFDGRVSVAEAAKTAIAKLSKTYE